MAVFYFYAHASMQFQTSGSIVPPKKNRLQDRLVVHVCMNVSILKIQIYIMIQE
jgi:hypothetical protein